MITLRTTVVHAGPVLTQVDLSDLWQNNDIPGPMYIWIDTAKIMEPVKTPDLPPKVVE